MRQSVTRYRCRWWKVVHGFGVLALNVSASVGFAQSTPARRPNIVLIMADDLGYGELGCYGGSDIPTPHLDALAAGGVRFTSGYVTASYCAPSRAGLITGRYQTRFGFEGNPVGARNEQPGVGLPPNQQTLAGILRDAGYTTALVGKWHLGGTAPYHPQRRGFDEFFGFLHEGHFYVPPPWRDVTTWLRRRTLPDGGQGRWTSPDGRLHYTTHMGHAEPPYDANNPLLRGSQPVEERGYLTRAFTREGVRFIQRHRDRPFFLMLSYSAVHSPMQATREDLQRMEHIEDIHRRIFAGMLASLDDGVGQVRAVLRDLGLEETTLVVFLSDNGGPTRELTSRNDPLRGGKGSLYEGGIRVPFLMYWPGRLPVGRVVGEPVISLDLLPTILAAAQITPRSNLSPLDGQNLLPVLLDEDLPRDSRTLYWRMGQKRALRQGPWKLVRAASGDWELYHLDDDLGEQKNLATRHPEKAAELAELWHAWSDVQAAPRW